MNSFVAGDLARCERQLAMLEGILFDEGARGELKKFSEALDGEYKKVLELIDAEARRSASPARRPSIYEDCDRALDWKLEQLLRFHQDLARKYSLI